MEEWTRMDKANWKEELVFIPGWRIIEEERRIIEEERRKGEEKEKRRRRERGNGFHRVGEDRMIIQMDFNGWGSRW
jgi:hypothetical protein